MDNKELVGRQAAYLVEDHSVVGLGTGSTAWYFIDELGKRVQEEGLSLKAVSSSIKSIDQAKALGIEVLPIDQVDAVDLTIDGVDEFTDDFDGIKGGGGALLEEKIVATYSKRIIWVAEERKHVDHLGAFPLAVEVIKNGHQHLFKHFEDKGYQPTMRKTENGDLFHTDNDNYIIDLHLEAIKDPKALADELIHLVGVVEHGLFLGMTEDVLLAQDGQVYFVSGREFPKQD
ncbi:MULTISPECIES: ribose-5-phosphate isomerase RpiA [Aerococcus]|uniref:ribose-5-phosphate isomerase RpiA n=1 Tax=Aerococcus TaxID=1375 RepID=UPI000DCE109C|nr:MULTISPECIES: ribose-5-phosphate isomerase RpiA [Aerococcus]KAA9298823.1 ribose-5-phosphate isomerase RpiA [Aerococcus tenax]MDK6688756.1 ribose-5-phosphate isomerase RpiA [Aerococcus urinae]MDK8132967.1 ribose-5-phosphate isomerase RpiA [Aerococcus urinae]MDK8484595.1 ribose-5-phosphate isomerase RpiA [Aerococcus urinae]MDL5179442.1 ribose-5-phosphate isomerase RpiA [Aerococcus tenax]